MKKPALISFNITWINDRKKPWKVVVTRAPVQYLPVSGEAINQARTHIEFGVFRLGIVWENVL